MKLTTMKISVPVLMLMMFQSGYGVSDWFEKAWGLMNQGKKAEAYAVVKQAGHGADKIYPQDRDQCFSVWSKAVSDAVSEKLPSYYYGYNEEKEEDGLTPEGEALRNEMITLNDEGIIDGGRYFDLVKEDEIDKITAENVKSVFLDTIVANVYTPGFEESVETETETNSESNDEPKIMNEGQSSAWLLPDNNLLAGFIDPDESEREDSSTANRHAGIYAWASRIAHKWQSSENPVDLIEDNAPYLMKGDDSHFVLDLKDNIDLEYEEEGQDCEVKTVVTLIENKANVANQAILLESYDEQIAKIKDLAISLRDAVEGVLIERIKGNLRNAKEAENAEAKEAAETKARENLSNYLKVAFNRTIDTNSSTVKAYGTEWGLLNEHDPLEAILAVAVAGDNAQAAVADEDSVDDDTVINIRSATEQVMADDLSLLLRSDKERRNILDERVIDDTGTKVNMTKVERALRKIAQPLADDVTDSVVENLQLIKDNWVEPDSGDESD